MAEIAQTWWGRGQGGMRGEPEQSPLHLPFHPGLDWVGSLWEVWVGSDPFLKGVEVQMVGKMGLLASQQRSRHREGQREWGWPAWGEEARPQPMRHYTVNWAEQSLTLLAVVSPVCPMTTFSRVPPQGWASSEFSLLLPPLTFSALCSGQRRQFPSPGGAAPAQHPGQRLTLGLGMAATRASFWLLWSSLCSDKAALLLTSFPPLLTLPLNAAAGLVPSIHHRFTLVWLPERGRENMERGKWADWPLSTLGFVSITHQRESKGAWRNPGPFLNPLQLDLTQRALVILEGTTETQKR